MGFREKKRYWNKGRPVWVTLTIGITHLVQLIVPTNYTVR